MKFCWPLKVEFRMLTFHYNFEYNAGPVSLLFIENSLRARHDAKSCSCIYLIVLLTVYGHFPDEETLSW